MYATTSETSQIAGSLITSIPREHRNGSVLVCTPCYVPTQPPLRCNLAIAMFMVFCHTIFQIPAVNGFIIGVKIHS